MALQCATSTQCLLHPFPSLSLKISPHCLIDKIDDSFSLSANQASFVESPPYFSIRKESRRIARILSRCMWEEERQQLSNGERVSDGISRLWQKCPRVTSSERVTLHSRISSDRDLFQANFHLCCPAFSTSNNTHVTALLPLMGNHFTFLGIQRAGCSGECNANIL